MKGKNKQCKGLTFDECELTILRMAVDKTEERIGKRIVSSDDIQNIIDDLSACYLWHESQNKFVLAASAEFQGSHYGLIPYRLLSYLADNGAPSSLMAKIFLANWSLKMPLTSKSCLRSYRASMAVLMSLISSRTNLRVNFPGSTAHKMVYYHSYSMAVMLSALVLPRTPSVIRAVRRVATTAASLPRSCVSPTLV